MRGAQLAPLVAFVLLFLAGMPVAKADGQIECSSDNYRYRYCRVDTGNVVQLSHQQSKTRCEEGRSWGYDARGIWVDNGCGAIFEYGYRGGGDRGGRHKDKTGDIVAGVAAVAILGAILSSGDSGHSGHADRHRDADYGSDRVPNWAVGGFSGSDRRSGTDIALNVDRDGRVSGYYGRDRFDGQIDGDGAYLGHRRYQASQTREGFQLIADDDRRTVLDLYRD